MKTMMKTRCLIGMVVLLLAATLASAQETTEIVTRTVAYEHEGTRFEGYLAYPAALEGSEQTAPGVLVIHEWWGLNEYTQQRTRQLAELGYVAFAADMYGQGKITADPKEAGEWAGQLYEDRAALRDRAAAALGVLRDQPVTNSEQLAVLGYCFGGTTALELAYAAPEGLRGAVSFHGNPKAPEPDDDPSVPVLILHGAADPLVSDEQLDTVKQALAEAEVDWTLIAYSGAKHGFTNPKAGEAGMDAVAYDERADKRSWAHMRLFLAERLTPAE